MGLLSWLRGKKSEPEVETDPGNIPYIAFELHRDAGIRILTYWPRVDNTEEAVELVKAYAQMVCAINSGKLAGSILQSVALFGGDSGEGKELARGIITLSQMLQNAEGAAPGDLDKPVIDAEQVFAVRGNMNND